MSALERLIAIGDASRVLQSRVVADVMVLAFVLRVGFKERCICCLVCVLGVVPLLAFGV